MLNLSVSILAFLRNKIQFVFPKDDFFFLSTTLTAKHR